MRPLKVSKRAEATIFSPIRKFMPLMSEVEARGVKIYKLNTGDPDIETPALFFQTLAAYKSKNVKYAPSSGDLEHVAAWAAYYKSFGVSLLPKHIVPTAGCAEAILFAIQAIADPGDEIIVFEPVYVSYKSFAAMTGVRLVPVSLELERDFALPSAAILEKKITPKTRGIVVINPDNPTGKLWSAKELSVISACARRHNLFIIADETYREIRFTRKPHTMLSEKRVEDQVIVVDSASKRFSVPGARVGCVVSRSEDVMRSVLKFAQARLSVGTLEQFALSPLLRASRKFTDPLKKEYRARRDAVYAGLRKIPGVVCTKPEGAFYIYARLPIDSAEKFVKFLISDFSYRGETVMVSPMADFYITPGRGGNEIRIAYVLGVPELKRAMELIGRAVGEYQKKCAG